MDDHQEQYDRRVADYWDRNTDATYQGQTYWLANPLVAARFNRRAVGGRDYDSWVNFCVRHYLGDKPVERILTIGCGDGALDRHLASLNAARVIDGIDIAPNRIEIAREEARRAGMEKVLRYTVCNAETTDFPATGYDAIFFNMSLHHMAQLEPLLIRCRDSLKPRGFVFVNEYIGPNRFAFSDREKQAMQELFRMIPEKYRVSQDEHDRGQVRQEPGFPDPAEVARVDPSEAIRSADIVPVLKAVFEIREFNDAGGSLQQFLLHGIAGNFHPGDPDSVKALELVFQTEDALVQRGEIPPHFALIVARHRSLMTRIRGRLARLVAGH